MQSLSCAIDLFNTMVVHALDQIVPLKKVTSTRNITQPWYDNDIKAQHQIMQRRERLWKKYKFNSLWKAYQHERNCYVKMTRYKKWHHICTKIKSKKNYIKNLYKLINHLTRNETQNRLPDCDSDSDLANRFTNYFIEKIDRIRAKFNNIPPYKPQMRNDIPSLIKFTKITETKTQNIINRMETKNCELDRIPTKILKSVLPSVLQSLTHIINLSLDQGKFDE